MQDSRKYVIVGAGQAGCCAAYALRGAGFRGRLTLVGNEAHPPYERPPLSKQLLAGDIPIEKTYLKADAFYEQSSIDLVLGTEVVAIDRDARHLSLADGGTIEYDKLLLTTGARARHLKQQPSCSDRILYLRNIADCLRLRSYLGKNKRLLIIGAGFVGLEVAAIGRRLACEVTVVEAADYPLNRVAAPEIGEFFADVHRQQGVKLILGQGVDCVQEDDEGVTVVMESGATASGDIVLVAIGAQPNVELAERCGLAVHNGIVVDQFGRTSDPVIYAAGDATYHFNPLLRRCLRLESWQNAQNQAIAIGKIMNGSGEAYAEMPWFWSDQYDINFQTVGAPTSWTHLLWRGRSGDRGFTAFYMDNDIPVGGVTVNNPRDMRFVRQIVSSGAPVNGTHLTDMDRKLSDISRRWQHC